MPAPKPSLTLFLAFLTAVLALPAAALAQSLEPPADRPAARGWREGDDWRRRAAAEAEAMQAVAELFAPAREAPVTRSARAPGAAPAEEPSGPAREPPPGDPSLFFE